jgi:hypothetical protein
MVKSVYGLTFLGRITHRNPPVISTANITVHQNLPVRWDQLTSLVPPHLAPRNQLGPSADQRVMAPHALERGPVAPLYSAEEISNAKHGPSCRAVALMRVRPHIAMHEGYCALSD